MEAAASTVLPFVDPTLGHAAAAAVGALLLMGAIDKLRDPERFRDAVDRYQLLPAAWLTLVARGLPLAELLGGALLIPTATRAPGAALALGVLLAVTAGVAINLRRGRDDIDCGCGGDRHTPLSWALVVRNGVLMLLVVAAAAPPSPRSTAWFDLLTVGFGTLFLLGLYVVTNVMLSHHHRLLELRNLR